MKRSILLIFVVLAINGLAAAQGDRKYGSAIKSAASTIAEIKSRENIPGLSAAIAVDGKVVWQQGFGDADLENHVKVTPRTKFRVGSVSKLITATAITKLYENGNIDLDAPIQAYVPSFPKKEYEITVRELLGHLAGIRHYKRDEFINRRRYENVLSSLDVFRNDPLVNPPNTKYLYSSYGFVLLGAAVEGASKQAYLKYVSEHVLAPLGMIDTVADDAAAIVENRTRFYARGDGGAITNEVFTDTSDRLPAGGLLSTASDIARLASGVMTDGYFKPETRKLVFTRQKTSDGKETIVGFGWRIGKDAKGRTIYYHGGESVGGRAIVVAYPESHVVVAVLCNLTFAKLDETDAARVVDQFIK